MPVQSREQLKNYFRNGTLVKEEHFADLIDSTVNKLNDNIISDNNTGIGLTPSSFGKKFLSFFRNSSNQQKNVPSFVFQHADGSNGVDDMLSLAIPNGKKDVLKDLLVFKRETTKAGGVYGKVGINTNRPVADLDVNGSVGMKMRIGRYRDPQVDQRKIITDGKWHKVLTNLKGFNSFEIMAVAFSPSGKYAMYYNIVMKAFGRSGCIRPMRQLFTRRRHRIQMRWVSEANGAYGLEARTASNYRHQQPIVCQITKLWN